MEASSPNGSTDAKGVRKDMQHAAGFPKREDGGGFGGLAASSGVEEEVTGTIKTGDDAERGA